MSSRPAADGINASAGSRMFKIDPTKTHLAREFKDRPFGEHSPELQAVLNVIRSAEHSQDLMLVCLKPHREWVLEKQPDGKAPRLLTEKVFDSVEAAEWAAFKMRWERITGHKLDIN